MDRVSRKDMLQDMLAKEPNDVFLNYAMAVELQAEQKYEEAKQQFLETLKLCENYLPCFYQLGQTLEKMNDAPAALEFYKKGLELARTQKNHKAVNEINEAIRLLEDE